MQISNVMPLVRPTPQTLFAGLEVHFSTRAGLEDAAVSVDDSNSKTHKRDELTVDAISLGTHPAIGEISDDLAQHGEASVYMRQPALLVGKVADVLRGFHATVAGATSMAEIFDTPADQTRAHERAVTLFNQHKLDLIPLMESVLSVPLERFPIGTAWASVNLYGPRRAELAKK